MELSPLQEMIFKEKYALRNEYGEIVETTVEQMWTRVATALARNETELDEFYNVLSNFKFVPGGRILAGAGSPHNVTMHNCYVMGRIPDSIEGIFEAVKEAAITMQAGGGIGYDFSTIRPRGAPVKKLGAFASGPVSFMHVWDTMCETIMSAGKRRGAMMATLRIDHPDIREFIHAKKDGKLKNFNISVAVTNEFMNCLENNKLFPLEFNGDVQEIVLAKELWNEIIKSTYECAEPGVVFIDRINDTNPLKDVETIYSTNPCVTGDTLILTDNAYRRIDDIIGKEINIWNGFEWSTVIPRITQYNATVYNVEFSDGGFLKCTDNHTFILESGERKELKHLSIGDKLKKHKWPVLEGKDILENAYTQGFYSGDGWITDNGRNYIALYGEKKKLIDQFKYLSDNEYNISGGYKGTDLTETRIYLYLGMNVMLDKTFVPNAEYTLKSRLDWLAGIADSDGTVTKDGSIQITSKDKSFLFEVKLMLNTLGITGNISPMKDCYRISISCTNHNFLKTLGFRTFRLFNNHTPNRRSERSITIKSINKIGVEDIVYCFTENKRNSGIFNGILTGQCGEQPLPPYGACCLGAMNLTKYVEEPFRNDCCFWFADFERDVETAVKMLDRVIDISKYPLEAQEIEAKKKRRIGLGVTGLADTLAMLQIKYNSQDGLELTDYIFRSLQYAAKAASSGRNGTLLTVAPTGTTSLLCDNVSSGIEPIFQYRYNRNINGVEHDIMDYAVKLYGELGTYVSSEYFQTVEDLTVEDHINIQAICQKYVDSSISKTINVPEDMPFEEFKNVYKLAWDKGLKGCTTYRPNKVTGSILTKIEPKTEYSPILKDRPDVIIGETRKIKWPDSPHAIYVTVNKIDGKPYELFLNTKNPDNQAWMQALTRMISAVYRRGGDTSFVAEELQCIYDPKGGAWINGHYSPSILAEIGKCLDTESEKCDTIGNCPQCDTGTLIKEEGCEKCIKCGYTKCS